MTKISPATYFLLQLSMLKGIGPASLKKLSQLPEFEALDIHSLAGRASAIQNAVSVDDAWDTARRLAERQVNEARREDITIISSLDTGYPLLLSHTKDNPFILYVKGRFPLPRVPVVAIIGTRSPTKHGEIVTERITEHFACNGVSILSGLALGCDSIAHKTALRSSAHTVAVLAHGMHTITPSSNKQLATSILDSGGTLVSEYPYGVDPRPAYFVQRDRTQAGMSQGVVMVQSDLKGGSLHASRAILKYGRWLAVPYPTESDIRKGESKVQANLILASADKSTKMRLLETHDTSVLANLIVLRGKEDYQLCPLEGNDRMLQEQVPLAYQLQVPLETI